MRFTGSAEQSTQFSVAEEPMQMDRTLHDVNGTQCAHVNNDDERNPRSVLRCTRWDLEFSTK